MSTANKLTYLNTTKQKIKDGINALGGELTNESTFRSYANVLNDLYEDLPKVTNEETDEDITLNNTRKGKMTLDLKGNTEQTTYTGKNSFNQTDYTTIAITSNGSPTNITKSNDSISFTSNSSSNSSGIYINTANFNSYTDNYSSENNYYLSVDITTNVACAFKFGKDNSSYVNIPIGTTRLIARRDTGSIVFYVNQATANIKITNIMVSTSSDTTFEPYVGGTASPNPDYPQEIHNVSGDNEIKVQNKNLLEGVELGDINSQTGAEGTSTSIVRSINYIPYDKDENYYFSVNGEEPTGALNVRLYNKNKEYIGYATMPRVGGKIGTITKTTTIIDDTPALFRIRTGVDNVPVDANVMVSYDNDLTYVPHQEYTKEINLGDLEVGGIGEYEDEFFKNTIDSEYYDSTLLKDKWYLKKRIGKVVLDGSEDWQGNSPATGVFRFYKSFVIEGIMAYEDPARHIGRMLSNYFSGDITNEVGKMYQFKNQLFFQMDSNTYSSVNDWKAWLSAHNTIVYYVLATPKNILLNDTLQETLDSFYSMQEQTNISQSNFDLPFKIKATALKDFSSLVN